MAKIKTSDRYYKAIAEKLRCVFAVDTRYKPSEMPSNIRNIKDVAENYYAMENTIIYTRNNVLINSEFIPVGLCAYLDMETYTLPNCSKIPRYTFSNSTIQYITIPETVVVIGGYAFDRCINLTNITIPDNVTEIGHGCFQESGLTSIILPVNVKKIGNQVFYKCANFTRAIIKGNYVTIGYGLFQECPILELVDFKGNVENLYKEEFYNCEMLTTLILRGTECVCALENNTDVLYGTPIKAGTGYIYVPSALIDSYKAAENWSTYANQFRALESYTADGTVTGELDFSKV